MSSPRLLAIVLLCFCLVPSLQAQDESYEEQYERPVDVAPTEEDIGEDYTVPLVQRPLPRSIYLELLDIIVLVAALGLSSWIVLAKSVVSCNTIPI